MSRRYQVRNTDKNEKDIVAALRKIPGVKVQTDVNDILIGYRNKNYWIEVKNPDEVDKNGAPYKRSSKTYEKQKSLLDHWTGQYAICTSLDQILNIINVEVV